MKRFSLVVLLAVGCGGADSQFARHEQAAWSIEAECEKLSDSVASGQGPDDFKERFADLNKRRQVEIDAARAARREMEKPPTRDMEIETLENLIKLSEIQGGMSAGTISEASKFAKAGKAGESREATEARADASVIAVQAMARDQTRQVELIKQKHRLELLKGLYVD